METYIWDRNDSKTCVLNSVEHFKILTCNHEVGALIYERLSTCCAIVCCMHMYNIAR